MKRLLVPLVLVFLVACGASAREKALRVTFTGATAAQAGFVTWDRQHLHELAQAATSEQDGIAAIEAYKAARAPVEHAFEATYRALAAAALVDGGDAGLFTAVQAFEQLRDALRTLTKGRVP